MVQFLRETGPRWSGGGVPFDPPWVPVPTGLKAAAISPSAKWLAVVLLGYANADGEAWPKVGRLAAECQASERAVRYWLAELKAAGFVQVVDRRPRPSLYRLNHAAFNGSAEPAKSAGSNLQSLPVEPAKSAGSTLRRSRDKDPIDQDGSNPLPPSLSPRDAAALQAAADQARRDRYRRRPMTPAELAEAAQVRRDRYLPPGQANDRGRFIRPVRPLPD